METENFFSYTRLNSIWICIEYFVTVLEDGSTKPLDLNDNKRDQRILQVKVLLYSLTFPV